MNRREFLTTTLAVTAIGRVPQPHTIDIARIGASTACLAGLSLPDAIRQLDRLGFGTIEMIAYTGARHSVGDIPGFDYAAAAPQERQRVFEATRPFRHISAHLPFADVRLFSSSAEDRRSGIARLQQTMDGLAFLGGEMAVMHVGWPGKGQRFRDIWQLMIDTLRALGDHAGKRQLMLGIETMQPDSVEDYAALIADVDHPHLGAVIDTGHIRGARDVGLPADRRPSTSSGRPEAVEGRDTEEGRERFNDVLNTLVERVGKKVLHVHVSDVRRTDWVDHREIGTGIIDFPRVFATLKRIGYRGLYVLELEEPDTVGALRRSKAQVERSL